MPLSLSSNSLQFFLFFFYPTLPFDITHFTFLGDKPVDSIIHPSAKSAHLYIHNLTQVSSHAVENIHHTDSTTRPVHDYAHRMAISQAHDAECSELPYGRIINTADASIRQIKAIYCRIIKYGRKINAIYEVAKYGELKQRPHHNCCRKAQTGRHIPCNTLPLRSGHKLKEKQKNSTQTQRNTMHT
jgi:hypothetical protein